MKTNNEQVENYHNSLTTQDSTFFAKCYRPPVEPQQKCSENAHISRNDDEPLVFDKRRNMYYWPDTATEPVEKQGSYCALL